MHRAEKESILGMITMMRQALNCIETIVVNQGMTDKDFEVIKEQRKDELATEEKYLSKEQEDTLEAIFDEAIEEESPSEVN